MELKSRRIKIGNSVWKVKLKDKVNGDNNEYWLARELQTALDYKEWRKFENVINKAKESCKNSDISALEHFVDVDKLSKRANNAEAIIKDYKNITILD